MEDKLVAVRSDVAQKALFAKLGVLVFTAAAAVGEHDIVYDVVLEIYYLVVVYKTLVAYLSPVVARAVLFLRYLFDFV